MPPVIAKTDGTDLQVDYGKDETALVAELEKRRSDLRNGLTDRQRLFLFGELGG
jgi:hypothetical protein